MKLEAHTLALNDLRLVGYSYEGFLGVRVFLGINQINFIPTNVPILTKRRPNPIAGTISFPSFLV